MTDPASIDPAERERAFEKWFKSVEEGDGEIPIPTPSQTKQWDEYVLRHAIAWAAWQEALIWQASSPQGGAEPWREAIAGLLEIEDARIATGAFKPNAAAQARIDAARDLVESPAALVEQSSDELDKIERLIVSFSEMPTTERLATIRKRIAALAAHPVRESPAEPNALCVRCKGRLGDRIVIGTGWICCYCATDDEVEL